MTVIGNFNIKTRPRRERIVLTKKSLRTQCSQYIGHGIVEQRHSHRVAHGKPVGGFAEQSTVFERPHGVYPRLAGTVNETAVDPTGHSIYLYRGIARSSNEICFLIKRSLLDRR